MVKDMTKGSPIKLLLSFSMPMLIGNIFQQFYNMVDTIVIGRYEGANSLAAVGSVGSLTFLLLSFVMGFTTGASIIVSQYFGAKDEKMMRKAVMMGTYIGFMTTILFMALGLIFIDSILHALNLPLEIYAGAKIYMQIILCGMFATTAYNICASVLRALGDSKTPLLFLIMASLLNVVLDLLFVIILKWSVAGVAIATVLSQLISAIMCIAYIIKKYECLRMSKEDMKLDKELLVKVVKFGIPMSVQNSVNALGMIIIQSTINSFGTLVIAAYTAATKIDQIAYQPLMSLGMGIATYTGQNIGANKINRVREGVNKAVKMAVLFYIGIFATVNLLANVLLQIFISAENVEIIRIGREYLLIISFFYLFFGYMNMFMNVLRGMGNSFIPMIAGFLEFGGRLVVAFVIAKIFGYIGVWFASPTAWILACALVIPSYFYELKKLKGDVSYDRKVSVEN